MSLSAMLMEQLCLPGLEEQICKNSNSKDSIQMTQEMLLVPEIQSVQEIRRGKVLKANQPWRNAASYAWN